ncbi:MAG: rhodanese-like domain-containing protein, partial [Anaerolineae bacterium]|nr:rhodanese-like domain-containing protein [Anaerolineae bacterium]
LIYDDGVKVVLLDVRDERDFNLFHIEDSRFTPLDQLDDILDDLREEPANTVFFTISNDETAATEAWRTLVAESIPNVYILGGGINKWIEVFGEEELFAEHASINAPDDELKYSFSAALGSRYAAAQPHIDHYDDLEFEEKVELVIPRGPGGGGCG